MATVDFLPFAFDPAANVLDQADYLNVSVSTWRQLGFSTGTALSPNLNKVWRQSSLISSMVANFAANATGADMIDDGSTTGQSNLLTNFTNAVRLIGSSGITGQYLPIGGGTLTGPLIITAGLGLQINGPAGVGAAIALNAQAGQARFIGGQVGGHYLWTINMGDQSAQTGSNQGANFLIGRYSDAGAAIDFPLTIARNTGIVNFSNVPTVAGGPLPFLPLAGGILSGPVTIGGQGARYAIAPEGAVNYVGFGWTGTAAELMVNGALQGLLATQAYVQGIAGAYLPLAGGTITGNLAVNGTLNGTSALFASSVSFAGRSDFVNYAASNGLLVRAWQNQWYDAFNPSNGIREWAVASTAIMQLDSSGNLSNNGTLRAGGGRIISWTSNNNAPVVTCYGGLWSIAAGMWVDSSGLWLGLTDASGNPANGFARLQTTGVFEVWNNGFYYAGLTVTGILYCYSQVYGAGFNVISDPRFKYDIQNAAEFDSLGAIAALPIRSYTMRATGAAVMHGFVSTDFRDVGLDDVIRTAPWKDGEMADHVEVMPLLAHLCRAVRQLNQRLDMQP